ncbi:MAG: ABC transporter permease [Abditibacteriota bacterium]|nr:ABC transporter permease [Abditibacteriota bacterium]MBP5093757.1 ABC transporter permease [Abditibacteriota bacterium]MBP5718813.1 ABC transporter permease [Abditibacteriota bacterium]
MVIWAIAKTTFGDALRKKILQIFLAVTIGLIILSLSFSQVLSFSSRAGVSSDLMLLKSFGLGLMALAGLLISVILSTGLIPQEIERRTIYTILAKPVKRYEFIIGKFLGAIGTLAVCIGLMGLVFVAVVFLKAHGATQAISDSTDATLGTATVGMSAFDPNTVYGVLMIFMQFMILTSVVLFFSTFLTQTVNFFMGCGVYIVGVMATVTETFGHSEAASPLLRLVYKVIYCVVPNFDKFNVTNSLLHPDPITNMGVYTLNCFFYAVIYSLIMMILAILCFDRKEV